MPSHGSLTKAGKVRSATPKIPAKPRRNSIPRIGKRKNYFRREIMGGIPWRKEKAS
ncbi:MAG: 30S ribosomal protein S30e [Candidatus Methanomethylicia archaeon]